MSDLISADITAERAEPIGSPDRFEAPRLVVGGKAVIARKPTWAEAPQRYDHACSEYVQPRLVNGRVVRPARSQPAQGGLLSRGFGPASYPTEPLGSYHVLPTTTWMDPPSTGDLRRWGAPLTTGWAFSSPTEFRFPPDF